jgi:hypothetical protein
MSVPTEQSTQYQLFHDIVFSTITEKLDPLNKKEQSKSKQRRSSRKASINSKAAAVSTLDSTSTEIDPTSTHTNIPDVDLSSLADFSSYIATEIFVSLPHSVRTLTHSAASTLPPEHTPPLTLSILESLSHPIPPSVPDTLSAYSLASTDDLPTFLSPVLHSYLTALLTPPPPPSSTRPSTNECELCYRTHLPLTYHHLIPKSTHAKVLKRGWHGDISKDELNKVAWLCRACHSWVHRQRSNEELARDWYSMERIRGDEGEGLGGVEAWVSWVGGVRWKKR